MNKGLYRKLACQNIKKNKNTFFPFSLSCMAMVAMFYMLDSIRMQTDRASFYGDRSMLLILNFGIIICGIFSVFVIVYTNSFLMKRRAKELGLYSILGLEKKHIGKVVFWEIAIVGVLSIGAGMICGMLFSRLMFLVLLKILHVRAGFTFQILPEAVLSTTVLFGGVFLLIMLLNAIRVFRLKPIELMSSSRTGEREPRAKWLLAVLGTGCLLGGYYLAMNTKNPVEALNVFFVAVLLVIAGTYLLFLSGSIALLKLLKKNKKYYYHHKHFITVSGLIYRMKQNATGLANICILSTAVLIVLSSTVSLYVGIEDVLRGRFPKDVITNYIYEPDRDPEWYEEHYDYEVLKPAFYERAKEYEVRIKDYEEYYSYATVGTWQNHRFTPDYNKIISLTMFEVMNLQDYNLAMGTNETLEEGEVFVYASESKQLEADVIRVVDLEFSVAKVIEKMPHMDSYASSYGSVCIVVKDMDTMMDIRNSVDAYIDDGGYTGVIYNIDFNLEGDFENKEAFCTGLRDVVLDTGIAHTSVVENIFTSRQDFFGIYGSLFFIGIFIGTLFLITTVMIIYYKQISEGYEDRERFQILQKVGMSSNEVKGVIRNQILLVFFLPILLALIHICFAMDIIKKILMMLNLLNTSLFVVCIIVTAIIFLLVYGIVYSLTARTYYQITYRKG